MNETYFLHQVKKTNGAYDKGIVVKDSLTRAKQSYHSYLGTYAYGNNPDTTYVSACITDYYGRAVVGPETWIGEEPKPEPEPEPASEV